MLLNVDDRRIGRAILVLRQRRGWRQADLGRRAGISPSAISDMERGHLDRYTLARVRRVLNALDASGELDVMWSGRGSLDRLLDADHARLMEAWAERHPRPDWEIWNEASYSIYGERGRIDMLAFHAASGVLEVTEGKTGIWDVQDTLGRLDVKIRLAPRIAAQRGWTVRRAVGALVIAEGRTSRRRIADHATLFNRFDTRGRAAYAFVREPRRAMPATGLLVFLPLSSANQAWLRRAGQRRVRLRAAAPSVNPTGTAPSSAAHLA
jgi:transcriptional regulator with XRE-family HTH domain